MLAFSCRRDLANLSERQRTAPGGTRRTMAKRASVASDFGHRPRVAEAVPPYLALKLGGTVWVGAPEPPRFIIIRCGACNSLLNAVTATPLIAKEGVSIMHLKILFFLVTFVV